MDKQKSVSRPDRDKSPSGAGVSRARGRKDPNAAAQANDKHLADFNDDDLAWIKAEAARLKCNG